MDFSNLKNNKSLKSNYDFKGLIELQKNAETIRKTINFNVKDFNNMKELRKSFREFIENNAETLSKATKPDIIKAFSCVINNPELICNKVGMDN